MSVITLLMEAWRWLKSIEICFDGKWRLRIALNKAQGDKTKIEAQGKIEV